LAEKERLRHRNLTVTHAHYVKAIQEPILRRLKLLEEATK
jgi:hypothetical protein